MDKDTAWRSAEAWVAAWNRRDLDAIMEHYTEDVEFWSPTVIARLGIPSGKIEGKAKLREHFARGVQASGLRFELLDVLLGVDGMTLVYRRETGVLVVDVVALDENGKGRAVRAYYGTP